MKRTKLFYVSIMGGGFILLVFLVTLVTGILIKVYVTQEKIDDFIAQMISKQTGGKLEYKIEKFDVLNEIRITGISLIGPNSEWGVHEGGALASRPIFTIHKIEINPSVGGLWRRVAKLKYLVDRPEINLLLEKNDNNLKGLLAYRAKNFPPEPSLKPWYELPILPFSLDKINIPGVFEVEDSSISGLSIHLKADDVEATIGPLDLKSQLKIKGKEINALMQATASHLHLMMATKKGSGSWEINTENKFQLTSWTNFQVEGKSKVTGYKLEKPLQINGEVNGAIKPDLTGIDLSNLSLKVGKEITMSSVFNLNFPTHSLLSGVVESKGKFQMGLDSPLATIATHLFDISVKGVIKAKVEFKGPIDISAEKKIINLPKTEITANIDNLSAQVSGMLKISDLFSKNDFEIVTKDGEISVSLKNKLQFSSLQFEKQPLSANLQKFELMNQLSGNIFAKKITKLETQIQLEKASASIDKKMVISEPFSFHLSGNSDQDLGNLTTAGGGALGKILDLSLEAKCNMPCKEASLLASAQAKKIMPLIALAKNSLADDLAKKLPSFAEGAVGGGILLTIKIPDLNQKKFRPEDFSPRWTVNGAVSKLSLKIPTPSSEISNLNADFKGEGDLSKATLKAHLNLDKAVVAPSLDQTISAVQTQFNSETQIQIPNLKSFKDTMMSQTSWQFKIKDLTVKAAKEFTFSNHEVLGDIKTKGIDDIWLTLSKASLADGGLVASLNLYAKPSKKTFETDFKSKVIPSHFEKYVPGLKASGDLGLEGKIAILDFEKISIQLVAFMHKIKVRFQLPDGKQVASIENLDGKIPITFKEKLSDIKKWFEKVKADSLNEKVSQYLVKENQITNLSLPEAALVSWRDAKLEPDKHIRIQKAYLNGVGLDEFDGNVEITSKAILVKNFQGKVLGGRFQGNAFIPISPYPERVVITAHVKGIEAGQIPRLVGKEDRPGESKNISGNFHLDFLVRNNLVDGLFDITSIGSEQMSYMLEMVDPDHADASINNIRRALKLGTLKKANVKLKRGELSLDLDIRVAGLPVPLPKLDGIKVTNMIENIKADLMSTKEAL